MADINLQIGVSFKMGDFVTKDSVTNTNLSATYSNLVFDNSNPEVANFEPNVLAPDPESKVKASPLAIGSGTVTITVDVTYTDLGDNQQHTETKIIIKTFEVIGAPNGASLELVFP